jgi:hypothetical protein
MSDELNQESSGTETNAFFRSIFSCFIGAIGGFFLFFLGLYILMWILGPDKEGDDIGQLVVVAVLAFFILGSAISGVVLAANAPAINRFIKRFIKCLR